jgi:excisionase family DNA binding protein
VDNPDYMTAAEAAVLLGRSSDWVRRLAKDGTLEAVQGHQGKKVLVTKASVEAYAKANKVQFRKVRRAE